MQVKMDIEAGHSVVSAFHTQADSLTTMQSTLKSAMDNLISTWHGNSKGQFEGAWSEFTSLLEQIKQMLETMRSNLDFEVRQVEETFSQFSNG